jgi:hypothetical protein
MLNRLLCHAAPWAYAWLLAVPAAQAADVPPPQTGREPAAPFDRYQGWRDTPPADWRETNHRVGAVGGWRTYLRESQPETDAAPGQDPAGGHHH